MKQAKKTGYHIICHVGLQETRPSVTSQAEVKRYVTGCDSLSLSTMPSGTRNLAHTSEQWNGDKNVESKRFLQHIHITVTTTNAQSLQEDIKLAQIVKPAIDLNNYAYHS